MSDDFITLQCPNCGGNLEIGRNVTEYKCTHCGMEHLVRQSAGGVSLEAFARCPVCGRNDRAEKVSSILRSQVQETETITYQTKTTYIQKGKKVVPVEEKIAIPTKTTQSTDLAKLLTPPKKPKQAHLSNPKAGYNWATCLGFMLLIGAMVALVGISSGKEGAGWVFLSVGLIASSYLIHKYLSPKVKDNIAAKRLEEEERISEINTENEKKIQIWQSAMERYDNLYYCQRDDVVFIPGETKSAPVNRMKDILFTLEDQERISKQFEEDKKRKLEQIQERKRKLDEERISKQKEKDSKRDSSQENRKQIFSPKQRIWRKEWGILLVLVLCILGLIQLPDMLPTTPTPTIIIELYPTDEPTIDPTYTATEPVTTITPKPSSTPDILLYTLYKDDSYSDYETFKVIWDIIVTSDEIDEASLEQLMEHLYNEASDLLPGPSDDRPQLVFIYLYPSQEHADAGMGQWVGMVSKPGNSTSPSYSIDELTLAGLNATPEVKLGLSELERREIWNQLVHIEDRSFAEAEKVYPDLDPYSAYFDLAMELQENYLDELAQTTGLTREQLEEIALEAAINNWPFPTQMDW